MALPDPELDHLYRHADYIIDEADVKLTIRLDRPNPKLHKMLRETNIGTWAFLTAYNPNSQPASPEQNTANQAELIRTVERHGHRYLNAYGTGDGWEPEDSLFVCDIDRETAISLGKKFGQSAILWGQIDSEPELVWTGNSDQ
jgi:hypothetical protein